MPVVRFYQCVADPYNFNVDSDTVHFLIGLQILIQLFLALHKLNFDVFEINLFDT